MSALPESKWISEEAWRRALNHQHRHLQTCERSYSAVMRYGAPADKSAAAQYIVKVRRRIARIRAAGLPEWRQTYDALKS